MQRAGGVNYFIILVYIHYNIYIIFLVCITKKKTQENSKEKEGAKRTMPIRILTDYIGKKVRIYIEGELGGFEATVLEIEENWIKVEEKKNIRILNGDMITQILISK